MEEVSQPLLVVRHAAALSPVAVSQPLLVVHHAAAVSPAAVFPAAVFQPLLVVHHAAAVSPVAVRPVVEHHAAAEHREAVGPHPAAGHHAVVAFLAAADHAVVVSQPVEHLSAAFSLAQVVAHVGRSPSLAPFSPRLWQPAPPPASVTARLVHLSSLDEAVGRVEAACVL